MRKLAIKKLKKSDLTFFKAYFSNNDKAKQKGFNLDIKLMEGEFFPGLRELLKPLPKKSAHVDLTFMGPGLATPYTLARKIKIDAKNLRLNGELVHDPDDQPGRFKKVTEDDFALLEFGGTSLPDSVRVVLISATMSEDGRLHTEFMKYLLSKNTDSMCAVSEDELQEVIEAASPASDHPIRDWLDPALLEEVAVGDSTALDEVTRRRPGRGMSAAELKASQISAERTGELGEELLDAYFDAGRDPQVESHKWISQENAISPYDFYVRKPDGESRHVDAKSTSGAFETPLHLSMAEIRHALSSGVPYDLYRLYSVKETGAKLRIARDIKEQLATLMGVLATLPQGVGVDSLSFKPNYFAFDADELVVDLGLVDAD